MTTLHLSPMSEPVPIAVPRATLAAESTGSGRDVILLHAGVADRRVWRPLVPYLDDGFRLIAYDRRGFGEAEASGDPYDAVADLLAVLDHFSVESAVVVGNSMGGELALDFALAHPDRLDGLVVMAPGWSGGPYAEFEEDVSDIDAIVAALKAAEEDGDLDEVNRLECHIWLDGPRSVEGRVTGAARELFLDMNRRALDLEGTTGEAAAQPEAWDRLPQIDVPAAVVQGELDEPGSLGIGAAAAERMGARFVVFSDVAHLPSLEVPAEVAAVIRDVAG